MRVPRVMVGLPQGSFLRPLLFSILTTFKKRFWTNKKYFLLTTHTVPVKLWCSLTISSRLPALMKRNRSLCPGGLREVEITFLELWTFAYHPDAFNQRLWRYLLTKLDFLFQKMVILYFGNVRTLDLLFICCSTMKEQSLQNSQWFFPMLWSADVEFHEKNLIFSSQSSAKINNARFFPIMKIYPNWWKKN